MNRPGNVNREVRNCPPGVYARAIGAVGCLAPPPDAVVYCPHTRGGERLHDNALTEVPASEESWQPRGRSVESSSARLRRGGRECETSVAARGRLPHTGMEGGHAPLRD